MARIARHDAREANSTRNRVSQVNHPTAKRLSPSRRHDRRRFLLPQRHIRDAQDPQLLGAAVTLEPVEQQPASGRLLTRVHTFQRLLDPPHRYRRQEARFASLVPQPIAFIPRVRRSIVGPAAGVRSLPPMMLPATERTTQVDATRVTRMRQELQPAVSAVDQTRP